MRRTFSTGIRTALLAIAVASLSVIANAAPPPPAAGNGTTTIRWLGQAAFEIKTPSGKVLLIDPWLKNPMNPDAANGKDPLAAIPKVDYILITHGHFDHVGDAVEIGKKTGARLVTNFELGQNLARLLGYPEKQMGFDSLMNIGGEITIADGEVIVMMVPAIHSSGLDVGEGKPLAYGGNPAGFVLRIKNGPSIYHTGDTAFFRDMELIGEGGGVDVGLINIGGHFGMSPKMAVRAADAVKAKVVVPHHYKSFPILTQDPSEFARAVTDRARVLAPGGTLTFVGNKEKK